MKTKSLRTAPDSLTKPSNGDQTLVSSSVRSKRKVLAQERGKNKLSSVVPEVAAGDVGYWLAALRSSTAPGLPRVAARIDVGLGNSIFIRGQGGGLNWDKGTPLACTDACTWVWSAENPDERVVFKLLLNDTIWAAGDGIVVEPGGSVDLVPIFHSQQC